MNGWQWLIVAVWLTAVPARGQETEVDRAEVLRLGDMVQHIGGIGSEPVDAFVEAMGPPASDADKWFISVLTMQGCAPCVKLKSDWSTSPWLLALADPSDPKTSWAHYNVYAREDQSQGFRFANLQIEGYPTIIVQPPRSKRYGDPKTVVFQGTYGGDPEKLARQITAAIRQYLVKLGELQPPQPAVPPATVGVVGIDPPWQPPPRNDPLRPDVLPILPDRRPLVPPNLRPADELLPGVFRWGTAGTVAVTAVSTLLLTWVIPRALQAFRQWRIASGRRTLLNDSQFEQLLAALRAAGTDKSKPPSST